MMVSNKAFKVKVNELITAMGGTPETIVPTCEDDVALNADVFATGINKIKQNIGGGSSSGGIEIVTFREGDTITADKTIDEIWAAYQAGKIVTGKVYSVSMGAYIIFTLSFIGVGESGGGASFVSVMDTGDGINEFAFTGVLEIDGDTRTDTWEGATRSITTT